MGVACKCDTCKALGFPVFPTTNQKAGGSHCYLANSSKRASPPTIFFFLKNGRDYRGHPTHHGCAAVMGFSLGLRNSAMVCLNVARPSYRLTDPSEG